VRPNSAIFVGKSRHVQVKNNSVARGKVAKSAVAVDPSCDKGSVQVVNNRLV
jgi:hypothetical protein